MIYNQDQQKAIEEINQWKKSKDLFHSLSGGAGSGKTTTLKEIISNIAGVCVSAPTHKAKKQACVSTGLEGKTMHSLLGLRPNVMLENFDSKNVLFDKLAKNAMSDYDYVVIDEASMLNLDLKNMVKETAKDCGTKILFVGDKNQLPPVKELSPSVFNDDEISNSHLSIIERQKSGNPLLDLYEEMLVDINSHKDLFKKETNVIGNLGKEFHFDIKQFGLRALEFFSSEGYNQNKDFAKLLCFTGDNVRQWNNYIRKQLYGGISSPLQVGECLMGYESLWDNDNKEFIIQNSYEYIIIHTERYVKKTGYGSETISGFNLVIKDLDSGFETDVFIVENNISNYNVHTKRYRDLEKAAVDAPLDKKKWQWGRFYDYKKRFMVIGDIKDNYGNVIVKKDLDFSYALTIHKSQGSTYTNVLVDEQNIDSIFYNIGIRTRLKYVAFSRPTNMAIINSNT